MEKKVNTSAGEETASQTVARINAARKNASTAAPAPEAKGNPLVDALTERVIQQGKGISSSSSSSLQDSINEAIAGTQAAGDATAARLQSERSREVSYAQDRAGAQFTNAIESRSGFATQTAAFKELTETTEKSVRDLDQRYQESIMANDANTAGQIATLRMQKLEFQAKQEQDYFNNLVSVTSMSQQADQFAETQKLAYQKQLADDERFAKQMAQSTYQFEKNLGIQYEEIGLKEQELNIARERNQLSRDQFNEQKSELNREKSIVSTTSIVTERLKNMKKRGQDPENMDPADLAVLLMSGETDNSGNTISEPVLWEGKMDEFYGIILDSTNSDVVRDTIFTETIEEEARVGGIFGEGGLTQPFEELVSSFGSGLYGSVFGVQPGNTFSGNSVQALTGERPF